MLDDPAPLGPILCPGLVTGTSARLWFRAARSDELWVRVYEDGADTPALEKRWAYEPSPAADGTAAFVLGAAADRALSPNTPYRVELLGKYAGPIGTAELLTAPLGADDCADEVAFAVMSCNQPFDDDGNTSERARSLAMLTPDALRAYGVSRVFMVGDQMYTDDPGRLSLFRKDYFRTVAPQGCRSVLDCSREQVRELLHARYRQFWKLPELKRLMSGWACNLTADDHEIVDNFGSSPKHATARFANFKEGALDAFYDYQASRSLARQDGLRPRSFDHGFSFGRVAVYACDLRSEKQSDGTRIQVMSERQFRALESFLRHHREKHVIAVVLSVPILHVPGWIATAAAYLGGESSDAADRWSYKKARADRDRLLGLLCRHQAANPRQRVVILGGDVHVGLVSELFWQGAQRPVYQLVSSALTNDYSPMLQRVTELTPKITREVCLIDGRPVEGKLLSGVAGRSRNPVGTLNFGTLHTHRIAEDESTVRLRLHTVDASGPLPRVACVFDSGDL